MQTQNQRYVFVEYDDLKHIKFKKLERVCSKMYILIDAEEKGIAVSLVKQTQRLGKRLKWVTIERQHDENMTYHLAFLMGRIHQKAEKDIEFAIISNDTILDPLVAFINHEGRSCLRVKNQKNEILTESAPQQQPPAPDTPPKEAPAATPPKEVAKTTPPKTPDISAEEAQEQQWIEKTARETVKRLIRSGNRPSDLSLLKTYILLHNQELAKKMNLEKILDRLQETKEIQIENEEVVYNF